MQTLEENSDKGSQHSLRELPLLDLIIPLPNYVTWRLIQLYRYTQAAFDVLMYWANVTKAMIISRMFWGRSSFYRSFFHTAIVGCTVVLLVGGLIFRTNIAQSRESTLDTSYGNLGNFDLLQQGGNLTTVLAIDEAQPNYIIYKHIVRDGENLDQIASQYNVSKDTIKWANDKLLSYFTDDIRVGWELLIPEIDGVLHEVRSGETVDTIASLTQGNRFDIIELNELAAPGYDVVPGERIFIPKGQLKPPPAPTPSAIYGPAPDNNGYIGSGVILDNGLGDLPAGIFDDPLTHPACSGYRYERGITSYHDGVDLSKGGGCPIRAIAAGTVVYAGWRAYGAGFTVIIDHGGGVMSQYMHGNGHIWVQAGEYVMKGQAIMYMGTTGNSTGVHLHLTLKYNGVAIDPAPYVPYRRP